MAAGAIRYFEDVTGNLTATVFRDAVDRAGPADLRVSPLVPGLPESKAILEIRRDNGTLVVIDFSASTNSLGLITFSSATTTTNTNPRKIEQYLWPTRNKRGRVKRFLTPKSSLSPRTFTGFDGTEYTWVVRHDTAPASSPPQPPTFVCSSKDCPILATYHPLPQASTVDGNEPSAAVLEIAADSIPLLPELIATLTIMRYVERYPDAQYGVRL